MLPQPWEAPGVPLGGPSKIFGKILTFFEELRFLYDFNCILTGFKRIFIDYLLLEGLNWMKLMLRTHF